MPGPTQPTFVGRYEIVERLATGGMADVFLGVDRGPHALDRLVVVKRVLPSLAADPETVEMFTREARIVARVRHPNVVQIHELGESDGLPFLAMQYVEGITLHQLLQSLRKETGARLSTAAVTYLLDQALAGLHAAHELTDPSGAPFGLVHRDVSPHNLMIDVHAHVTLLDFGIAKDNRPEPGHDATRKGLLKGKIAYMSPEQARQEPLDRRSDVFAAGIVAYELLTLRRPFQGSSDLALLHAMVHGDRAPLASLRPDAPRGVLEVIDRALAVKKEQRWPSAEAMRLALWDASRSTGVDVDRAEIAESLRAYVVAETRKSGRAGDEALERTETSQAGASQTGRSASSRPPTSTGGGTTGVTRTVTSTTATGLALGLGGVGVVFGGLGVGALALVAGALLVALAAIGALGWWWFDAPPEGAGPVVEPAVVPDDAVVVAVAPVMDPAVLEREHAPIEAFLEPRLGRDVRFEIAKDYGAAAQRILDGSAPFAMLPEATARVALQQEPRLQLLVVKEIDGSTGVDAVLVARPGVPVSADDPASFRGRTVCFTDPRSSSGHRYPTRWFTARGLDPDTDLTLRVSGSHEQVVRDLVAGQCEVGATHRGNVDAARADGTLGADYLVVAVTGVTRHDVLVAPPSTDPVLAGRLRELLLKYDPTRASAADKSVTGFDPVPAEYARDE